MDAVYCALVSLYERVSNPLDIQDCKDTGCVVPVHDRLRLLPSTSQSNGRLLFLSVLTSLAVSFHI